MIMGTRSPLVTWQLPVQSNSFPPSASAPRLVSCSCHVSLKMVSVLTLKLNTKSYFSLEGFITLWQEHHYW
ncbi:hypothetical protein VNO78_23262 [Psophocarpus tetragonolobus]|uniref:Uncharacterized protein n=1 Tax=Psophocarpus tetragonolobus TaxID=3891 RepID=A0AAN9S3P8_PSOTE